jgi:hypothetical protein
LRLSLEFVSIRSKPLESAFLGVRLPHNYPTARGSARPARRLDAEIRADLAHESEVDLAVAWHGARALGIEAPEAVVAALAQEPSALGTQVSLEGRFTRR